MDELDASWFGNDEVEIGTLLGQKYPGVALSDLKIFQTDEDMENIGGMFVSFSCNLTTDSPTILSGWNNPNLEYFDGYKGELTTFTKGKMDFREITVNPFPQNKVLVDTIKFKYGQKVRALGVVNGESFLQGSFFCGPKKGQTVGVTEEKTPIDQALLPEIKQALLPQVTPAIKEATSGAALREGSLKLDVDLCFVYWEGDFSLQKDTQWKRSAILLPAGTTIHLSGKASRGGTPYQWKDEPFHGWSVDGDTTAQLE
jgi:hypothetical protein